LKVRRVAGRETPDTAELHERRTVQPVITVFLHAIELEAELPGVAARRVQQGLIHFEGVEDEITRHIKFAAERQRAVIEVKPREIAERLVCRL